MRRYICIIFYLYGCMAMYAQEKKVYIVDEHTNPVSDFQLYNYYADSVSIYKSNNNNYFVYNRKQAPDSIIINYDFFYTQKVNMNLLAKQDTLVLKKEVALSEVVLEAHKKQQLELGVTVGKGKIHKSNLLPNYDCLIQVDASAYVGATIESVSIYLYKSFWHSYYSRELGRISSKNKDIKIYLFQSNKQANEIKFNESNAIVVVNTEDVESGWFTINLKELNLTIEDYKYLYIGCGSNRHMSMGYVRANKLENPFIVYGRYYASLTKDWHIDNYDSEKNWEKRYIPAIKIQIVQ